MSSEFGWGREIFALSMAIQRLLVPHSRFFCLWVPCDLYLRSPAGLSH
jgi:hypothetical protein